MLTHDSLRARLDAMSEPEYARFAASLIPACPPLLGVRLPRLRALAKELASQPEQALAALGGETFEERMLRGMVIGYAALPPERRRKALEEFLPLIDNWSVCDSVAATCKCMARQPGFWLPWLHGLARRQEEFPARFGLVCLLDHFTADPAGREETLRACAAAASPALYARLGCAWAVSEVCLKDPARGEAFLRSGALAPFTQNKAIAKICESRRCTPKYRALVRTLRAQGEGGASCAGSRF